MRGRRLWLCVPPALLGLTFAMTLLRWSPNRYVLSWQILFLANGPHWYAYRLLAWILFDPFIQVAALILWLFLSFLLFLLPNWIARALSPALSFGAAALAAHWLPAWGWGERPWVFPLFCLAAS